MPALMAETASSYLAKRQRCDRIINGQCYTYEYSRWNDWGRWVALAIIVIGILIIAFLFSCINNRRRRRRGLNPMYGTGWVPAPAYKPPQPGQPGHYGGAAPPYSPPINNQSTGNTFNSNDGYYGQQQYGQQQYGGNPYGGQQSGVELQTPQHSYQPQQGYGNRDVGGENVYAAPPGAPPGKGDGIVR